MLFMRHGPSYWLARRRHQLCHGRVNDKKGSSVALVLQPQSCSVVVPFGNRLMALHPLMCNALPRSVLGAALLSVTATVYAAGSWFSDASSCTSGPPNVFYIGVCKSGTGEIGRAHV